MTILPVLTHSVDWKIFNHFNEEIFNQPITRHLDNAHVDKASLKSLYTVLHTSKHNFIGFLMEVDEDIVADILSTFDLPTTVWNSANRRQKCLLISGRVSEWIEKLSKADIKEVANKIIEILYQVGYNELINEGFKNNNGHWTPR